MLNKMKIINNLNKRCEIGNIFDDIVNSKFNLNNEIFGLKIDIKIVINSILDLDKIYIILTEQNSEEEINYELNNIYSEENQSISLEKIFDDSKNIYLYQHHQGKNYDGGLLIPVKNAPGKYNLFIVQSSIKKNKKFSLKQIMNDFKIIKKNLYEYFGVEIYEGYFSYILYFEEKDMATVYHCQENNIGYFFYSYNLDKFVDDNGKEIQTFLNEIYLINKNSNFIKIENFRKNYINLVKNLFPKLKYDSDEQKQVSHSQSEKNNNTNLCIGKKVFLSSFINEKENKKIKFQNLKNLNICLRKKITELFISNSDGLIEDLDFKKCKSYDKLIEILKDQNNILIEKLNELIGIKSIDEEATSEEEELKIKKALKYNKLPKKIKSSI